MSVIHIDLKDKYTQLKEKLEVRSLKGEVSVFEKKNGKLEKLLDKQNTIVYGGRNWLLKRAFGSSMTGNQSEVYNKQIKYFAVGSGGGEPGNLLQAGVTRSYDTQLVNQIQMRSDLEFGDPGYTLYAPNVDDAPCYFKEFSSVVLREDKSIPYSTDGSSVSYPPLIAEIRIDLSNNDACTDLISNNINEAGLFIASEDLEDTSSSSSSIQSFELPIVEVESNGEFAIYYLDGAVDSMIGQGDYLWVEGTPDSANNISETSPLMIIDKVDASGGTSAYVVVERTGTVSQSVSSGTAHLVNREYDKYIMFSRCTLSTIVKSRDRELVFIWRIYF